MSDISFRPLERADLPMLTRWLNTPHVFRWWGPEGNGGTLGGRGEQAATVADVEAEYGPELGDAGTASFYVIHLEGEPIGMIQMYRFADEVDYATDIGELEPGGAGVDLLIGATDAIGRGIGPRVLDAFVRTVVFAADDITRCVAGPEIGNTRSIRAFEKAGFHAVREAEVRGKRSIERIMVRDRVPSPPAETS